MAREGKFDMKTRYGYDYYEVISALQKDIRRGKEEDALFWAYELGESGFMNHMLARLYVILHEDIGICDGGQTLLLVDKMIDHARFFVEKKKGSWRMVLANIVMAMCRAEKTREGENLKTVIRHRISNGWRPEIPDYALDMHTRRGKKLGRGLKFFVENEQQIDTLKNPGPNRYVDEANAIESGVAFADPDGRDVEEQPENPQVSLFGDE